MRPPINGKTVVAGVIGRPVAHTLSPLIHNAWLEAAALDGVYVAMSPTAERLAFLLDGLRGGAVRGLNITVPFKEAALAAADVASERASRAGAANLILFEADGRILADNTDGNGLLTAFSASAPDFSFGGAAAVILGAGGAARGAVAAVLDAGARAVRLVNRTLPRALALADQFGERVSAVAWDQAREALAGADVLINATLLGQAGQPPLPIDLAPLGAGAVVMDMVYRPLKTDLLRAAEASGRVAVDGLSMLIGQAAPSFEAFFGQAPPAGVDVRSLALAALGDNGR